LARLRPNSRPAPCTVVQCGPCFGTFEALDNHRVVAHRAAHEPALPREGGRSALAHHPQIAALVGLAPCVIMMVVHHVGLRAADDLTHALHHPFAPGVRIATCELHRRDVAAADIAYYDLTTCLGSSIV
jgi:hypothetical protein